MTELGIFGNATAAIFFLFLAILVLVNWRGQIVGGLLVIACVASIVWALLLAIDLYGRPINAFAVFLSEVIRTGAWLTFLATLLAKIGASRALVIGGILTWLVVVIAGALVHYNVPVFPMGTTLISVLNAGGLFMAMTGLLLVEQLHRNSPEESRRGIKVLMVGIGGIFVYDLFLYSQNLMLGGILPWAWSGRGLVNAAMVPAIAFAARSNRDWDLDIFVSRQVVFYSTTLAAVGVYLLLMSGLGYWIVIQGRTWSSLASMTFFVGAGALLVFLLFSSSLRARLRVFLSKHFFRNKYDYRKEWLRLISTLAEIEDSNARNIAIKALAQIVESPSGTLWVLDERDSAYQVAASYNADTDVPGISVQDPLVTFINQDGWLIDLEEFKRSPQIYGDLQLPGWLLAHESAWLIAPLITRGELLGLVMLGKAAGPLKLNYEDRDLLKTVGNHIAVHLAQESADQKLSESRQFEAYNRLTAFLMHDLNNLIAQQSLIVENASKHKRNPDFVDDAMNTIASSVERMKRVMDQLKRGDAVRVRKATELKFVVSAAADRCSSGLPAPVLKFNDNEAVVTVDVEQFTMALTHLIRNAQDATEPDGSIVVETRHVDGQINIAVSDDGCGMTAEFIRSRLFRPFDSTKGNQGMGIGVYQVREFARKMGGDLKVTSTVSEGTTATMSFPLA